MITAGIDIGGTFTDIAVYDAAGDALHLGKVFTEPDDPARGALNGLFETLRANGYTADDLENVVHGTTLVANVLIERKGSPTALLVTRGFRDLLEIGREKRYQIYNLDIRLPPPLIRRRHRLEVDERIGADGVVLRDLDQDALRSTIEALRQAGVEAIAVCLIHSYRNDKHERLIGDLISEVAPEIYQSLSVDVMPEIREYERMSTTTANAYAQPTVKDYLEKMSVGLRDAGAGGQLRVVLSSGGVTSVDTAQRYPVRILESGPAGGAIYAGTCTNSIGLDKAVAFDMGGTTAKICLIRDGVPSVTTDFEVGRMDRFRPGSGLPVRLPGIDLIEIGAGGGSIAHAGSTGLLEVGPQSAGADPGPVCYGRGGTEPTVTDADLILGYLGADSFLGGRLALDMESAKRVVDERLAGPLGLDLVRAAWGVHAVVTENMASAAQLYAAEKGEDLAENVLVAFGGAGPVHAYRLARRLRMRTIICPPGAGVASSIGFLHMPPAFDLVRTYITKLDDMDYERINRLFEEMHSQGLKLLEEMNISMESEVMTQRSCDMRFTGQGHEIEVSLPNGPLSDADSSTIRESFLERYLKLYRIADKELPIEFLNWRLTVRGEAPVSSSILSKAYEMRVPNGLPAPTGRRPAYFPEIGDYVDCEVFDRYDLPAGTVLEGPAIIEERQSTAIVGPEGSARVDDLGNLVITTANSKSDGEWG